MSLRRAAAAAVLLLLRPPRAHARFVINEGFNNVATLPGSGWILPNASIPLGSTGWFQGDQTIFTAQAGRRTSYIAANFNNAAAGGTIANWLISPAFTTQAAGIVSFLAAPSRKTISSTISRFGFSNGGSSFADFTLGAEQTIGGDWTQYMFSYAAHGAGAPEGSRSSTPARPTPPTTSASTPFNVTAAVPEPETWALCSPWASPASAC